MEFVYNPIATSSAVALFVCTLLLIVVVKSRVAIGQTLSQWRAKVFTRTGFFWIVNLVFMGVSVLHAGDFFGITGKDDFARGLGFAVSFFLDLVTIILMQAMLEARYRGEESRARQFLFFIMLCCGTSTFANLAISLNDFDPSRYLPHAPMWVQVATPYILASFPLFVIMMSIAAEMIINVRPLEQLDEGEYEADEKKRLKIIQIRNTYLQMQADEELRAISIRAQMRAQKPGMQWPWHTKNDDVSATIAKMKAQYDEQLASLRSQIQEASSPSEAHTDEAPMQARPDDAQEAKDAQVDAQEDEKPIDLDSRRLAISPDVNPPTDHEIGDAKRNAVDSAQMRRNVSGILKKNPSISGSELSRMTGLSVSQANRIKAKILAELVPSPA